MSLIFLKETVGEIEVKRGLKFICCILLFILTRNDFQAVGFSCWGIFPLHLDTIKMMFETNETKI